MPPEKVQFWELLLILRQPHEYDALSNTDLALTLEKSEKYFTSFTCVLESDANSKWQVPDNQKDFFKRLEKACGIGPRASLKMFLSYARKPLAECTFDDNMIADVLQYYLKERISLIHCVSDIVINSGDADHPLQSICDISFSSLLKNQQFVDLIFSNLSEVTKPQELDKFPDQYKEVWASQRILEAEAYVELLWYLEYHANFTPSLERLEQLLRFCADTEFGTKHFDKKGLTGKGRSALERLPQKCTLTILTGLYMPELLDGACMGAEEELASSYFLFKGAKSAPLLPRFDKLNQVIREVCWSSKMREFGPILLAWSTIGCNAVSLARKKLIPFPGADQDFPEFGLRALDLKVYDYIKTMVNEAPYAEEEAPNAAYVHRAKSITLYYLMSTLIHTFDVSLLGNTTDIVSIFAGVFRDQPELCEKFWEEDCHDPSLRALLEFATDTFPWSFPPLVNLIASLCSDEESFRRCHRFLSGLRSFTIASDGKSRVEIMAEGTARALDTMTVHGVEIPAGSLGAVKILDGMNDRIIQWDLANGYSVWPLLESAVNYAVNELHSSQHTRYLLDHTEEAVSASLSLVERLARYGFRVSDRLLSLVFSLMEGISSSNTCRNTTLPSLCMRTILETIRQDPSRSIPVNLANTMEGIVSSIECSHGCYPTTKSFLDLLEILVDHHMLQPNREVVNPALVTCLSFTRSVLLPKHMGWRYVRRLDRWDICLKSVKIINHILGELFVSPAGISGNKPKETLESALAAGFLGIQEMYESLFEIVVMGEALLVKLFQVQKHSEVYKLESCVECALLIIGKLIRYRSGSAAPISTMEEATLSLNSSFNDMDELNFVSTVSNYMKYPHDIRLPIAAIQCLTSIIHSCSDTPDRRTPFLSFFSDRGLNLRRWLVFRMRRSYDVPVGGRRRINDEPLRMEILRFLTTALEREQAGMAELFFGPVEDVLSGEKSDNKEETDTMFHAVLATMVKDSEKHLAKNPGLLCETVKLQALIWEQSLEIPGLLKGVKDDDAIWDGLVKIVGHKVDMQSDDRTSFLVHASQAYALRLFSAEISSVAVSKRNQMVRGLDAQTRKSLLAGKLSADELKKAVDAFKATKEPCAALVKALTSSIVSRADFVEWMSKAALFSEKDILSDKPPSDVASLAAQLQLEDAIVRHVHCSREYGEEFQWDLQRLCRWSQGKNSESQRSALIENVKKANHHMSRAHARYIHMVEWRKFVSVALVYLPEAIGLPHYRNTAYGVLSLHAKHGSLPQDSSSAETWKVIPAIMRNAAQSLQSIWPDSEKSQTVFQEFCNLILAMSTFPGRSLAKGMDYKEMVVTLTLAMKKLRQVNTDVRGVKHEIMCALVMLLRNVDDSMDESLAVESLAEDLWEVFEMVAEALMEYSVQDKKSLWSVPLGLMSEIVRLLENKDHLFRSASFHMVASGSTNAILHWSDEYSRYVQQHGNQMSGKAGQAHSFAYQAANGKAVPDQPAAGQTEVSILEKIDALLHFVLNASENQAAADTLVSLGIVRIVRTMMSRIPKDIHYENTPTGVKEQALMIWGRSLAVITALGRRLPHHDALVTELFMFVNHVEDRLRDSMQRSISSIIGLGALRQCHRVLELFDVLGLYGNRWRVLMPTLAGDAVEFVVRIVVHFTELLCSENLIDRNAVAFTREEKETSRKEFLEDVKSMLYTSVYTSVSVIRQLASPVLASDDGIHYNSDTVVSLLTPYLAQSVHNSVFAGPFFELLHHCHLRLNDPKLTLPEGKKKRILFIAENLVFLILAHIRYFLLSANSDNMLTQRRDVVRDVVLHHSVSWLLSDKTQWSEDRDQHQFFQVARRVLQQMVGMS